MVKRKKKIKVKRQVKRSFVKDLSSGLKFRAKKPIKRRKNKTLAQILHIANLLSFGHRPWEVKIALSEKWGCRKVYVGKLITRARRFMLAALGESLDSQKALAIDTYKMIARSPDARPSDRIKAQERIDKILGLETPIKMEGVNLGQHEGSFERVLKILEAGNLEPAKNLLDTARTAYRDAIGSAKSSNGTSLPDSSR